MPSVAIGLPTLDRGPLFERTLQSLLSQSFRDFELVVSDNASASDDAGRTVERLADPRVRYVRRPQRIGMGANWNACVALTTAPLVAIFHDDDAYRPAMLERVVARFAADPSLAFVHTATFHLDDDLRPLRPCRFDWPARVEGSEFRRAYARRPGRSPVEAQSVVMRRSAFEAAGPFRDDWVQATDLDLWLRLARHGAVGYVDEPLVDVRLRLAPRETTLRDVRALEEKCEIVRGLEGELADALDHVRARLRWQRYLLADLVALAVRGDASVRRAAHDVAIRQGLASRLLAQALLSGDGSGLPLRGLRRVVGLRRAIRAKVNADGR